MFQFEDPDNFSMLGQASISIRNDLQQKEYSMIEKTLERSNTYEKFIDKSVDFFKIDVLIFLLLKSKR